MAETPTRCIRLLRSPTERDVGVVSLTADRKTGFYVFREIPCPIGGRGFIMHRLGMGDVYHVRIGEPDEISCECLGFYRHGKCKHVLGLLALMGHGLI